MTVTRLLAWISAALLSQVAAGVDVVGGLRSEHEEESIRTFEECVEYHRSSDEKPARRGTRGERKRERD